MQTATARVAGVDAKDRGSPEALRRLELWTGSPAVTAEDFERAVRARMGEGDRSRLTLAQLCDACADVTSLKASIVLMDEGQPQAAMVASDGAGALEDLQLSLGEGPGVDAYREGRPVLIEDLAGTGSRWIQFTPAAQALGIAAVFAFPVQVGVIRTGVLSFYSEHAHSLDHEGLGELAAVAGLVTEAVLLMQAEVAGEELSWSFANAADHRAVVHQATGMIAMQLECSVRDAWIRLRGRAFSEGVRVDEVARQVVERLVRFDP